MKRRLVLAAALSTTAFSWFERLVAPSSELVDPHWSRHDADAAETVDHRVWTGFLKQYLHTAGTINCLSYGTVTARGRAELSSYLNDLERVRVTGLARGEQLAYWINLYNAKTVAIVLDHYPVESIRTIKFGKTFAIGPWDEPVLTVEGHELSLNDLEHGIIRPVFNEPRIHYALNCAAAGCPDLQPEAFTAEYLDSMLDTGGAGYVNHPRGVRFTSDGSLIVSSIYNWFAGDFGGTDAAIIDHLRNHAAPGLAVKLQETERIDRFVYDWALNDRALRKAE